MNRTLLLIFTLNVFVFAASGALDLPAEVIREQKAQAAVLDAVPSKELISGMKEVGEIDFRLGDLSVRNRAGKAALDEEDSVFEKDTIITGRESRCEIKLNDGSIVRLSENTRYVIDRFSQSGDKVEFSGHLFAGESWTNVNRSDSKKKDFQVRSPIAVAAVIGTAYKMTSDGQITEISVLDGKVDVDLEKEKKQELRIEPQKRDTGSLAPRQSMAPRQIPGPFEVTLSEWISVVKGEKISIRTDGKYNKEKTDINVLIQEWDAFKARR